MPLKITTGSIRRQNEPANRGVAVDSLTFPALNPPPARRRAVGDQATLVLKRPPNDPYVAARPAGAGRPAVPADVVVYETGNNNDWTQFIVNSVVGPSKYRITVTAAN
jgi:hypothetical protein